MYFTGKLKLPIQTENYFFLSAFGSSKDEFKFKNSEEIIEVTNKFQTLVLKTSSGLFDFCLRGKVALSGNKTTLELFPSHCNMRSGIICKVDIYKPPLCSSNQSTDPQRLLLDPVLKKVKEGLVSPVSNTFIEMFKRLNITASFEPLFRMLWYSNLPCFDVYGVTSEKPYEKGIIKACFWKGKPIPCAAVFTPIPTDRGMCCAFNMDPLNEIFNGQLYVNLALEMQNSDRQASFMDTTLPEWFLKDKPAQPGKPIYEFWGSKGLKEPL
jgi:hypothetical protein